MNKVSVRIVKEEAGGRRYHAPALEKGLDILELLANVSGGLNQTMIASRLGRNVNEIFRMLNCLEERGYLIRAKPDDSYHLSLKLFELGLRNPPTKQLIDAAVPAMRELANEIIQCCHVAILAGSNVLVVAQQDSPSSMGYSVRLGTTVTLHEGTSGALLLAYESPDVRQHWLAKSKARPADKKRLDRIYRKVLSDGYLMQKSLTIQGIIDIAFPIFNHTGDAVAALTVPFLTRLNQPSPVAEQIPVMRRAALNISAALGWRQEAAPGR